MSDSTFDLSFESELDEFDPLEDTGADDDDNEGGDYTAISSATDAPAQQSEAKADDRTPAERIDDLFKSMARAERCCWASYPSCKSPKPPRP